MYKVNNMIKEDTPNNYIDQLIKQVLSKATPEQNKQGKISFVNFNSKRKSIDKLRVDKNGNKLSNVMFKTQALNYFDANYQNYRLYRNIVKDALDDYLILENYFPY